MNDKPVILVDGSSYLFRAFHALPPLTNSKGDPTGAVYGVVNMLRKLRKDYDPEYMAVVFDPKGKTFRHDLYQAYKANRPAMPEELRVQIAPLFEIIKAMGLPLIIVDHYEADDVIGTFAKLIENHNQACLISTGDKDMAQLVSPKTTLINTMSNKLMDEQGVVEKFGVPANLIIDYLALIGDSVDNVPGVPKVGPKTAVKWLNEFGSLENIMQRADEFKGKVGENLRDSLTQLPLSKQLVTIIDNIKLPYSLADLKPQSPDQKHLIELFQQLEFKSWLSELLNEKAESNPSDQTAYVTITSEAVLDEWLEKLKKADYFAFDTETTSLNYMRAELVGIAIAYAKNKAAYIPLTHDYEGAPKQLNRDDVLNKFKPLLTGDQPKIIGQHLKYDKNVLARYGIELSGIAYDTMLESYILNSTSSRHDMDTLALKYLGYNTIHFEDVAGKGAKQITFNQVDIAKATAYAAEDADITLQLHEVLWPKLCKETGPNKVFTEIEVPLLSILAKMEQHGVLIDANHLLTLSAKFAKRITELEQEAHKLAGGEFNLASPKQLREILFEKNNLPVIQKTPSGQASTAEPVLEELALDYPLPKIILEYRGLSKLKSTYTDRLPEQIDPTTKRVHTSYHQAVTATGRLSSTDPNLQNIPIKNENGHKIRQAFIAPKGYKIIAADYSQIELRIMAHLSGDEGLLKAFKQGLDIHKATAAEVWGVPLDQVTPEQRRSAKAINFGLIYGMSSFGLAKQLGTDRNIAQEYIDVYFMRYPGVKNYMDETRAKAHKQGYVETLCGRRLYLPEINAKNLQRQRAAERAAINAPMQGTAADIIKLAMIKIAAWLKQTNIDASMIMQVHDELVFEVVEKDVSQAKVEICNLMQNALVLDVPLIVDIGIGDNWDEAH